MVRSKQVRFQGERDGSASVIALLIVVTMIGASFFYGFGTIFNPLRAEYDHIFIDCPPSLSLLTVYALAADRKRTTCFTMKVLEGQSLQQMLEDDALIETGAGRGKCRQVLQQVFLRLAFQRRYDGVGSDQITKVHQCSTSRCSRCKRPGRGTVLAPPGMKSRYLRRRAVHSGRGPFTIVPMHQEL